MSKQKILIVDDDPQVRKILTRMLENAGYELKTASDGFEALDQLSLFLPDLVILDIMMPGMSGIEVCQKIRQYSLKARLKILILSGKDTQADRREALELGGDDFVTKPFHIASLLRKIQHMLQKDDGENFGEASVG